MTTPFSKPALNLDQQIALLKARGMLVDDEAQTRFYLGHLNYYRLRGYWMPFEANLQSHDFRPGTRFSEVLRLYIFDRQLRLLILDAVERFEVSMRSQWAHHLATNLGPHAHLDVGHFKKPQFWETDKARLLEEVHRTKANEDFIRHFMDQYPEALPPVWVVCEVMSLGTLSRWYSNLKSESLRKRIANAYSLHPAVLESWLHHLTVIRNISAHHCRLWNRRFTIKPQFPISRPSALIGQFEQHSRKLYNSLVFLLYALDTISPDHHWRAQLKRLLEAHSEYLSAMGFPQQWLERSIWKSST